MDTPQLAPSFMRAGDEYVDTLSRLGMDIEIACWAFDEEVDNFVLLLITDFFDVKGPLEISKVLFRAYNTSVTPREIDPFTVRLHSTNHAFAKDIRLFAPGTFVQQVDKVTRQPFGQRADVTHAKSDGIRFNADWLLRVGSAARRKSVEISRRWDRFTRNVEKAAA